MLHTSVQGSGSRLVLVHGFTQSGRSWGPVAERFEESHEVVRIDAPGHGRSAGIAADLWSGADLLAEAAGGPGAWIGYSMGGRQTLHVSLSHPTLVTRLVLVSATPGIADAIERAERRRADSEMADRVLEMGLPGFVQWWLAQPLFASLPSSAADVSSRLEGTASGLASSLRLAGTGTQEPLWARLASLEMPVLLVAGGLDGKYRSIAVEMAAAIGGNASVEIIAGAGHACHLERPDQFVRLVEDWLAGA